jgi:deoxycytidylate deaminase
MDESIFEYKRKSHIELGEIYFWTAHAEAEALIKAKNAGTLPRVIDIYVDRVTCANSCRLYLPDLMNELGIDQINIYWKNQSNPPFKLYKK